jgi:hypothetical protein
VQDRVIHFRRPGIKLDIQKSGVRWYLHNMSSIITKDMSILIKCFQRTFVLEGKSISFLSPLAFFYE